MDGRFTVPLSKIVKEFTLDSIFMPEDSDSILVSSVDVNRPGLQLGGFFDYFDNERVQVIGLTEISFLKRFIEEKRQTAISRLFERKPPAVVICRGLEPYPEMLVIAKQFNVPLLKTNEATSSFMSGLISYLWWRSSF